MKIPTNLQWIEKKIKECEKAMQDTILNITTANEYHKLLEIHTELYKLIYWKIHQEENYLVK